MTIICPETDCIYNRNKNCIREEINLIENGCVNKTTVTSLKTKFKPKFKPILPARLAAYEAKKNEIDFHVTFCNDIIKQIEATIAEGRSYIEITRNILIIPYITITHPIIQEFVSYLTALGYEVKMEVEYKIKIEIWWKA